MSRDWTREEFGITDNTPVVDIDSLEKKCERLQKQLNIAIKCLRNYKSGTTDKWFAEVALEQIEELNK